MPLSDEPVCFFCNLANGVVIVKSPEQTEGILEHLSDEGLLLELYRRLVCRPQMRKAVFHLLQSVTSLNSGKAQEKKEVNG